MDEDQQRANQPAHPSVGTPIPPQAKSQGSNSSVVKWIVLILIILAVIAGLVWFFVIRGSNEIKEGIPVVTPSPTVQFSEPTPTPVVEAVDKTQVSVKVLNGTGIAGEASYLQGKLKGAGWEKITVGNADEQNKTQTEVKFGSGIDPTTQGELLTLLRNIYTSVTGSTSTSLDELEIVITTGLRKGVTPKPSPTVKPTSAVAPTVTSAPTPTSGALTPTPTPTPTSSQ